MSTAAKATIFIIASAIFATAAFRNQAAAQAVEAKVTQQERSFVNPTSQEALQTRSQAEAEILSVTVLIELNFQKYLGNSRIENSTTSHATVMAGRYLVTHNHFAYSLAETAVEGQNGYTSISLRRANGGYFVENASLNIFTIAYTDAETLVLEFATEDGQGLFENENIASADFADWNSAELAAGAEVAQVNWDGEGSSFVDWTVVETVDTLAGVAHIEIDNFAREGSSGSGIFLSGVHIGNTWARNSEADAGEENGQRLYGIIALNSAALEGLGN